MEIKRKYGYRQSNRKTGNQLWLGMLFIIGIMFLFWYNIRDAQDLAHNPIGKTYYVPAAHLGVVYQKPNFTLSYVEKYEIPEWVAYQLTIDMLNQKKYPREQDFNPDPDIKTQSAHYYDYKGSGFRRGHLVPSADMAWNKDAMDATFLLSNVVPMKEEFNDGIWLELEHNVRDWARAYKHINVVAGPVLVDSITSIGNNQVLVPRYYFKAIFTNGAGKPESIGFLFDQTMETHQKLENFIVPIDSIEKVTGLDLFEGMYGNWDEEIRIEQRRTPEMGQWGFNEKWYQERINDQ
jgi:endonuclease G